MTMPKTARKSETAVADATPHPQRAFKKQKFAVFLVTADDTLWPSIGADLSADLSLKQLDSIDDLLATVPAGQPGIVLWDARRCADAAATLSVLALHSTRFALIVLDSAGNAGVWSGPLQQRQIVAKVGLPISSVALGKALESAREEVSARTALLGQPSAGGGAPASNARKPRWMPIAIGTTIAVAAAVAFLLMRHGAAPPAAAAPGMQGTPMTPGTPADAAPPSDDNVDALIEKAHQAMSERHFIDPAAGSALTLYRDVLVVDPDNGEARQGLQRLAEILISRVQSALDERKFDVALQSLETARSIDANDPRLSALDERINSLRAELGPAQINAALNAQNFDHAAQLIDDATRAKSLPPAKLAQMRDDVRKRRDEFELAHQPKPADMRLQADKPAAPRGGAATTGQQAAITGQQKESSLARATAAPVKPDQTQDPQGQVPAPENDGAHSAAPPPLSGAMPDVAEQSLTRLNKLEVTYPYRAMAANIEGWVELKFTVNPDGTVGNVTVLNTSPPRTFEAAAIRAVGKLRYQPVTRDGRAIAVSSEIRVAFRMPK